MVNPLLTLLEAGILHEVEVLLMRRRGTRAVQALVGPTGNLSFEGKSFKPPSGAAKYVVNWPINGWSAWRNSAGFTLSHLRDSLNR